MPEHIIQSTVTLKYKVNLYIRELIRVIILLLKYFIKNYILNVKILSINCYLHDSKSGNYQNLALKLCCHLMQSILR